MKTEYKVRTIAFRCTKEEFYSISQRAQSSNRTVSDFCRLAALKGRVMPIRKLTEQEQQLFKTLHEHRHNFTLLGNMIRSHNPQLYTAIKEHLERSKQLFELFR